jgi:GNAT superfamily N-acetyltransferase
MKPDFSVTQNDGKILNLEMVLRDVQKRRHEMIGGSFIFLNHHNCIYQFRIESFNGCGGVAIVRDVYLHESFRGKGLGIKFLNLQEELAKDFGYSAMMCSVVLGNHPQQKILAKNDWKVMALFHNKRSGNHVRLYYKKL